VTPEELSAIAVKEQEEHASYEHVLNVCMESGCVSSRSDAVADALDAEIKKRDLKGKCCIKRVGCLCSCAQGPMVSLGTGEMYKGVAPEDAGAMIDALGSRLVVRPAGSSVAVAQDRRREKGFFAEHGLPIGPWAPIDSPAQFDAALARVKLPALLKTARFGYDGKGQARIASRAELERTFAEWKAVPCVLEELLVLEREVSVVLARSETGEVAVFPLAENRHAGGILDVTIAPARVPEALAREAADIASRLAAALDYVGVLAVEMFVVGGKLLLNEIAPRPHNSGHYTIDACRTSQFEQQVRVLCGLPLGDCSQHTPAVMVNLLGDAWRGGADPDWQAVLRHPGAHLHLYGKREARPGRKMGHVTICDPTLERALEVAMEIRAALGIGQGESA